MKKSIVTLTAQERQDRHDLIAAGKAAAPRLAQARVLLKADAAPDGPAWNDERIAEPLEVSIATVARVRPRFVAPGLEPARSRTAQDRPSRPRTRDGRAEDRLIAPAGSPPPDGRTAWTRPLWADRLVEREVVDAVADATVRRTLNKTSGTPGGSRRGACRRRPMPSSSARGRRCGTSPLGPSTRSDRGSAATRRASP